MIYVYFGILTLLWSGIWWIGFQHFRIRREQKQLGQRFPVKRVLTAAIAGVVLGSLYVFSYVPFLRLLAAFPGLRHLDDLFVPVQWLFDQTSLQTLLLKWAQVWHLDQDVLLSASTSRMRSFFWGTSPPWLYVGGWSLLLVTWCLLPPYLVERLAFRLRSPRNPVVANKLASAS